MLFRYVGRARSANFAFPTKVVVIQQVGISAAELSECKMQVNRTTDFEILKTEVDSGDAFLVESQRRPDDQLGLMFMVNDQPVARMSVCCEYKHRPGTYVGTKSSGILFLHVSGGTPCLKCRVQKFLEEERIAASRKVVISSSIYISCVIPVQSGRTSGKRYVSSQQREEAAITQYQKDLDEMMKASSNESEGSSSTSDSEYNAYGMLL